MSGCLAKFGCGYQDVDTPCKCREMTREEGKNFFRDCKFKYKVETHPPDGWGSTRRHITSVFYKDKWREVYRTDLTDDVGICWAPRTRQGLIKKCQWGVRMNKDGDLGVVSSRS